MILFPKKLYPISFLPQERTNYKVSQKNIEPTIVKKLNFKVCTASPN